jgi:restriction endonuclease Mrr
MNNSLSLTKRERDYILFNIRGFFRHYKIEQNITKLEIDISNIQYLEQEVNNLLSQLNEYKEEFNTIILNNNQTRQRLFVNRRNKPSTKSTDIAMKKLNEKTQRIRMRELKYDLNKSNLTVRPKTPDVSKIFDKHKNKKSIGNIKNLKNNIIENNFNENHNKLNSKSFIQQKKNINKYKINNINNISQKNLANNSNINRIRVNNKLNIKMIKRDNSIDNKNNNNGKLNLTATKFPKEYEIKKKNITNKNNIAHNKLNVIALRDISPNNSAKNKLIANKNKDLKKAYIYDRYHSTDIVKKKSSDKNRLQNINNIASPNFAKNNGKKFIKLNIKKRNNMKTPSPRTFRKSSPLLLDHETILKNKNRKINYNGHYHAPSFVSNKSGTNIKKENIRHNKIQSEIIMKKNNDITKEEEKKLNQIIDDNDINNKNILDLSQNILQNLQDMNNTQNTQINKFLNNNRDNLFMSNYIESLFLAMKSGFFNPSEKLRLLLLSKELYFKFDLKEIINDFINYYDKEIKIINNRLSKYDINSINKPFIPRKTGINSLNFITKNEEQRLINETQHDYVIKIFNIILIFLNEYNNIKENTNIFEFIFNDIYQKNNVNNIKDLFIKNFVDKIPLINDIQFKMVNDILKEVPDLLSPSTLLAYNRNVSYLIFFLSELYNYFSFKTNDNDFYYQLRNDYLKLNEYINKINKLKTYL